MKAWAACLLFAPLLAIEAAAGAQRIDYGDLGAVGDWEAPRLDYAAIDMDAAVPSRRPPPPEPGDDAEAGGRVREVYLDRTELLIGGGPIGYVWDWSAYLGGDTHRLYLASSGEGELEAALSYLEMQALYSRSIGDWDLQAGLRWDLVPRPRRLYATIGAQGYAAGDVLYLGGMAFLSHEGELSGRLFATYDIPLLTALILQPSFAAELAAQDVPALGIGSGLIYAEGGLRLRYRIAEAFSPYLGLHWERLFGRTADMARDAGEETGGWSLLLGVRSNF